MRLLFVGRCVADKGVDLLPVLYDRLVSIYPDDIQMAIAGAGQLAHPPTQTLDQLIAGDMSRHDDDIHRSCLARLGRQSGPDIQHLFGRADLLLMPSRMIETFGMSALEALTAGVPVVGPSVGGLVPFVHPDLDVADETGMVSLDRLTRVVASLYGVDLSVYTDWARERASAYTPVAWIDNLTRLVDVDKSDNVVKSTVV